ncbi:MAG: hypothetical protein BIFFINMI_00196 [Phycisphaerae bacterium]|nr:hypothetical protein [Phycisphaerae bacterium]
MKFQVYKNGQPASVPDVNSAYVVGQDGVPARAQFEEQRGELTVRVRAESAVALCLLYDVPEFGQVMLQTTRLPERDKPYLLSLELLRQQLFLLNGKFEDWGLIDYAEAAPLTNGLADVTASFIQALSALDDPKAAHESALRGLSAALHVAERAALYHASLFLGRRLMTSGPHRREPTFGCSVDLLSIGEEYRTRLAESFDYVLLPVSWKQIEPKEKELNWSRLDNWVEWAVRKRLPIWAGPLVSFNPQFIPDWLFLWEHDFDAIRDLIYEHISRVVGRYRNYIHTWTVTSGIAADNCFNLTFDQLIEMTRMACTRTKQEDPKAKSLIDVTMPWGEYHARNLRTIPPLLYADMVVQSGTNFDGIGLQFYFGLGDDGLFVRDLMSISALLDKFANFAKPLHVTAVQVPSDTTVDPWDAWGGAKSVRDGGNWRRDWDEQLQADWLRLFYSTALSKPYVRTVAWRDLADYEGHFLSHGGLCHSDLSPKPAFAACREFRKAYHQRQGVVSLGLTPLDLGGSASGGLRIFTGASPRAPKPPMPPAALPVDE